MVRILHINQIKISRGILTRKTRTENMKNKLYFTIAAFTLSLLPALSIAQDEPVQMNNLAVTDLSVATAFVSWTTDQKTMGNKVEITSADSTWEVADSYFQPTYVHMVQITGLQLGSEYSYRVISGDTSWDDNGESWKFTTLDSSKAAGPKTVWGKLTDNWGEPVERCLVRYHLLREDGVESYPRAVITDTSGTWIGDAGIMYVQGARLFAGFGDDKLITKYIANYWSTTIDSSKVLGYTTNNYYGEEQINVIDPSVATPGDVDGNGSLNIFDVLDLLKVMSNKVTPDPRMQAASDLDTNGRVDVFDLLELLKRMKSAN
jgi:hypothetical protein